MKVLQLHEETLGCTVFPLGLSVLDCHVSPQPPSLSGVHPKKIPPTDETACLVLVSPVLPRMCWLKCKHCNRRMELGLILHVIYQVVMHLGLFCYCSDKAVDCWPQPLFRHCAQDAQSYTVQSFTLLGTG